MNDNNFAADQIEKWRAARATAKAGGEDAAKKRAEIAKLAWDRSDDVRTLERELSLTLSEIAAQDANDSERVLREELVEALDARDGDHVSTYSGLRARLSPLADRKAKLEAELARVSEEVVATLNEALASFVYLSSARRAADEPSPRPLAVSGLPVDRILAKLEADAARPEFGRKVDHLRLREDDLRARLELAIRKREAEESDRKSREEAYDRAQAARKAADASERDMWSKKRDEESAQRQELIEAHRARPTSEATS
jgi:hypothetical protein